ncbi:MAG TPA: histidine ammonia-lyase [Anaerolineales bacterium]|nr:histidine ammonia-lyase [Anaerolineales bacterium]
MQSIILDGQSLTIEQVIESAYHDTKVELSPQAAVKVERAAKAVETLIERGEIVYGVTTGFGAFKDRIIPPDEVQQLQRNIIMSHAVGAGPLFDVPTTRAIMLIRANTLARGHSGIRLSTLQLLIELLNRGIHPEIPQKGSLGASGDLAPLAHMSLVMIGLGSAEYQGERIPGKAALEQAGLEPVTLAAKEGLALTNGTSVMCALGALAVQRSEQASRVADVAGCLSLEALNGTSMAFDERIHALRPHPRQIDCAAYLRKILSGSQFVRGKDPTNVQDAYTLRCIPQVHGAVREAVAYARWVIETELNAVTDNPLIFIDEETEEIEVISGGNFHGEPLAIAMDYLAVALTELGNISERRIMRLTDEASNAHVLPAFLTENGGLNSGFMITQYTAAALSTENKILAHPASVDTIPTSANVEDHVSMGCTAALKMHQVIDNVEHILTIELLDAAQGIDFRRKRMGGDPMLGKGTQPVYELIRSQVPFVQQDTVLYDYIAMIEKMVTSGQIDQAADQGLGGE